MAIFAAGTNISFSETGDQVSFFPKMNGHATAHCLTCGGTGKKGNLSGKKKCPACKGTGLREIELTKDGKPIDLTVCDGPFTTVTIPRLNKPWPVLTAKDIVGEDK